MRLGVLADIHADVRALESALHRLDAIGVDQLVCAGDIVGYGSQPDAAVALIKARGIACIRGNHDRWALERRQALGTQGWKPARFRDDTWEFLSDLPTEIRLQNAGRVIAVHHGSPGSDMEYVSPHRPLPASIHRFWDQNDAHVLILGHTHLPMIERTPRGVILNPGSILGIPGIPTSWSFAVLELEALAIRIFEVSTGREIRRDPIFVDWV
jgi:putative phosphoesterase